MSLPRRRGRVPRGKAASQVNREKRLARRRQVKAQALERFGLEVGKFVRQALISRVHRGDVRYARKLTHSRTVIVLEYAGREMSFVYSNATGEIVTFLPPGAAETAAWRNARRPGAAEGDGL